MLRCRGIVFVLMWVTGTRQRSRSAVEATARASLVMSAFNDIRKTRNVWILYIFPCGRETMFTTCSEVSNHVRVTTSGAEVTTSGAEMSQPATRKPLVMTAFNDIRKTRNVWSSYIFPFGRETMFTTCSEVSNHISSDHFQS
jgi:hypothetical protein